MQHIVYKSVVIPSSVRKSGMKWPSSFRSLPNTSWLKYGAFRRGIYIHTYLGGASSFSDISCPSLLPGRRGGARDIPGRDGVSLDGGAHMPLHLQHVCGFFTMPFWQERQPSVWFLWTIAGCLSIAAFMFLCSENTTPHFFCSGCTQPAYLAIVADMLKTYMKSVVASKCEIGYYLNHTRFSNLLSGN